MESLVIFVILAVLVAATIFMGVRIVPGLRIRRPAPGQVSCDAQARPEFHIPYIDTLASHLHQRYAARIGAQEAITRTMRL
jgi:hypothetical protein